MRKRQHLGLRPLKKRDRGAGPRKTHPKKCENRGAKQETKIEIRPVDRRLAARETVRRERLLLHWSNFLHAYFYGNWGVKVPIILQDKGI